MIQKQITIAETVIPAKTITLVPSDLTVFFEGGEVTGIRMSLNEGKIEITKNDPRWSAQLATDIETICQSVINNESDELLEINKKAEEAVLVEARQKAFDKAVAEGKIDEMGFPIAK